MPRDASGNYLLPLPDVIGGDPILADGWANPTLQDLANEMTDSLSRSGKGGFTGPILAVGGAVSAPGYSWSAEPSTGMYRAATGDIRVSVAGVDRGRWTAVGIQDRRDGTWRRVASEKHFRASAETVGDAVVADDVSTNLYAGGLLALRAVSDGADVRRTGPTGNIVLGFQTDAGVNNFSLLWNDAAGQAQIRGDVPGGSFSVLGRDGGDLEDRVLMSGNPDGSASLYHQGQQAIATAVGGAVIRPPNSTNGLLEIEDTGGAIAALVKINGGRAELRNEQDGQPVRLSANNSASSLTQLFEADPDGAADVGFAGVVVLRTTATGADVLSSGTANLQLAPGGGAAAGFLQQLAAGDLTLGTGVPGAILSLTSGVASVLTGDPAAETTLYYAGSKAFQSEDRGAGLFDATGVLPLLSLRSNVGATQAQVGFLTAGTVGLRSFSEGDQVALQGEDTGGVNRDLFRADPDAGAGVYYAGVEVLRTADQAGIGMSAEVLDSASIFRPVGMNVMPTNSETTSTSPFTLARNGRAIRHSSTDPHTWTVPLDASLPDGATWTIINGANAAGGLLTLDADVGVTIRVFRGSAVDVTSDGGTVEILGGAVATLHKFTDSVYHLWGNGIGNVT